MMRQRLERSIWLAMALVAGVTPTLHGEAKVALRLQSRQGYVQESLACEIEVTDFRECEPPELPALGTARMRQVGTPSNSHFTTIINGRISERRTRKYTYELTPLAVGTLVIPPIPVRVDGTVLYTAETKIDIRPSDADELFTAEIVSDRERIYVGQRVKITMRVWVKPTRVGYQQLTGEEMLRLVQAIEFGPFELRARLGRQRRPGTDPPQSYYTYDFDAEFITDRPGPLRFDDIEIGIRYPARQGTRMLRTRPEVPQIEVQPIPTHGRPPTFNDAVGLFDVEAFARPTRTRVGDPITLTLDLFGDGPVQTLKPPLLAAQANLTADFRVPDESLAGEMQGARKRFTVTIRAQRDDVTEIPPIEYAYFDPDAERFIVARSDPIPIRVEPAAVVEAPEVGSIGVVTDASTAAPLEALDGLRDIETRESNLLATTWYPSTRTVALLMFVPAGVFLLTLIVTTTVRGRSANAVRQRRSGALRAARKRLTSARQRPPQEFAVEAASALAAYLADRTDRPPARFTGVAAAEFLRQRGVRDEIVQQWATTIAHCEHASFAADAQLETDALGRDALACLAALEREKL